MPDQPVSLAHSLRRPQFLVLQLGIAFAGFVLIGVHDAALGVLLPSIQGEYTLDKRSVSTMFLASTSGYLMAAFSSGLLVERLGRRVFLTLGGALLVAAMTTVATVPPWLTVLLALVGIGFGIAVVDAGLNTFVASLPNNTSLLNYLHAWFGVGALAGPLLASTILAVGGRWNYVHVVLAVFALLLMIGFYFVFARSQTDPLPASESLPTISGNVLTATLRLPLVWFAALFLFVYVGAEVSVGNWAYSYLLEERQVTPLISGWLVSGYWLGLTLGRLVLGSVTRRLGDLRMIQLCLAVLGAGLVLLWIGPGTILAGAGLWLAGFSLGPIFPTMIAAMSRLVQPRLLPSAIGFLTSFGAGGAALFPWIAGNAAEAWGVWTLLPYALGLVVIMLGLWLGFQTFMGQTVRQQSAVEMKT